MAEIFAWPEGELHLWSGSHTASGNVIAYVRNINASLNYGWESTPAVDGTYHYHQASLQADFSFNVGYLFGDKLYTLVNTQTALHAKFTHSNGLGSAGLILYSGRVNAFTLAGGELSIFDQTINGFAHSWTGF